MARTTSTTLTERKCSPTSPKKLKKTDLIEAAIKAGVPANRLKGTIPQIQAEVCTYLEARAEAATDVADAVFAVHPSSSEAIKQKQNGLHPMNGLYVGGAIAALWHLLG